MPQTTVLPSCTGDTTCFTVLLARLADPVDFRITANGLVHGVHQDHFKILVDCILETKKKIVTKKLKVRHTAFTQ